MTRTGTVAEEAARAGIDLLAAELGLEPVAVSAAYDFSLLDSPGGSQRT